MSFKSLSFSRTSNLPVLPLNYDTPSIRQLCPLSIWNVHRKCYFLTGVTSILSFISSNTTSVRAYRIHTYPPRSTHRKTPATTITSIFRGELDPLNEWVIIQVSEMNHRVYETRFTIFNSNIYLPHHVRKWKKKKRKNKTRQCTPSFSSQHSAWGAGHGEFLYGLL